MDLPPRPGGGRAGASSSSTYSLSVVCHHQVDVDEGALASLQTLTERTNREFQYLLRREVGSFVFTGISGHSRILLESEDDLQLFLKNHATRQKRLMRDDPHFKPQQPALEVRLSPLETREVMSFLFDQLAQKEKEVASLEAQLAAARAGLPPFVQAVRSVPDARIPELIQTVFGGSKEPALNALNSQNPESVKHAARVLALLAADNAASVWDDLRSQKLLETMLTVLMGLGRGEVTETDIEAGAHLVHTLARFASDPRVEVQQALCGTGAPDVIVDKMVSPAGTTVGALASPLLFQYGCWFFGLLAANPETRSWLLNGNMRFLTGIVLAMQAYPSELYVIRYGVSALHSVSEASAANMQANTLGNPKGDPVQLQQQQAAALLQRGGGDVLRLALEKWPADHYIVTSALKALSNIACTVGTAPALVAAVPAVLPILKEHEVRTTRHALQFMGVLAKDSLAAQGEMAEELGVVLDTIRAGVQNPCEDSEEHALSLLANLARNRGLREDLVRCGIVDIFLVAVHGSRGREATHQILKTMAVFTGDMMLVARLGDTASAVLSMMDRYIPDEKVQMNGCYILGTLAVDPVNKENIGRAGGIQGCLTALHAHSQALAQNPGAATNGMAAKVLLQACAALAVLAEISAHKKAVRDGNGLNVILSTLPACLADAELAKQMCKLIALLALDPQNQEVLLQRGCPSEIVNLVMKHSTAKDFLYYAFRCLANLLSEPLGSTALPVLRMDFVDVLVRVMKEHLTEVRVQEGSCEVISAFARSQEYQSALLSRSVVRRIVHGMETHTMAADVQRKACWALAALADSDTSGADMEPAFDAVVQALRNFRGTVEVAEQACAALTALAVTPDARQAIASCDGIKGILDCLEEVRGPLASGVFSHGLGALGNLAVEENLRAIILESDGMRTALRILSSSLADARVCHLACLALANLVQSQVGQNLLVEMRGVELVADALRKHMRHAGVAEQACALFCNLGPTAGAGQGASGDLTRTIAEAGGLDLMLAALNTHMQQSPEVVEVACFALTKFVNVEGQRGDQYRRQMTREVEALRRVNKAATTFELRVCTNVLLRKLVGDAPTGIDQLGGNMGQLGGAAGGPPGRATHKQTVVAEPDVMDILNAEAARKNLLQGNFKRAR
ncbi:unnamed protein product [Amoebophrya sp. A25]|nr:unnamed protein product [Amoebophrya sp. A25]|eukprot:GSA25T00012727001.1